MGRMMTGTAFSSIDSKVNGGRLTQVPSELAQVYKRKMLTGVIAATTPQLMLKCLARMDLKVGTGLSTSSLTPLWYGSQGKKRNNS